MRRFFLAVASVLALSGCAYLESVDVGPDLPPSSLYRMAQDDLDSGDYASAVRYYEALSNRFPNSTLTRNGEIELAYAYYKSDDPDQALAVCERFLRIYPTDKHADYALYLKALILYERDHYLLYAIAKQSPADRDPRSLQESFLAFKELVTKYPNSVLKRDAEKYMLDIDFLLAKHDLDVAIFYLEHSAYSAALSRFQSVIVNHPNSPLRKNALEKVAYCYNKMGMKQLALDTEKIISSNYPKTHK
ncbi:outer membrane protein assembly factor [Candidatus Ichthyocystis hellenicum]|uniref:Outer membrane protein assembly factor BamD n=2 Tax=Burkholderiales genera incertae sedis TaxID=224471 RepID=A0A0S4M3S9_9BURK|nr:outer membrane protein assembly factor [Candidatus Ichthyocystis hellenicum]